ncbi:endonuclease NucS [Caldivirga sp.]|uniref:endonuclease NucS n=1 Tax=Caldivirga sp. TaxID=2080243 RepID=UPI003D0ADAAD
MSVWVKKTLVVMGWMLGYLINPPVKDAAQFISKHKASKVIVIYGQVEATYSGRASAQVKLMPRLIVTKPDGVLMIHEGRKEKPIIWNPPGSQLFVSVDDGVLVLRSIRRSPREYVTVYVPEVYMVASMELGLTEDFKVIGTEKDIVDAIVANPGLIEDGFKVISREYETMVGSIDLLGEDKSGNLVVVEVKRSEASPEAVHQLKRYVDYIAGKNPGRVIRGVLVAAWISTSAYRYLRDYGLEFRRYTHANITGFSLKNEE